MTRSRRCVYCSSTCLSRCISQPWGWFCLSCERIQPDPRYPPPKDIEAFKAKLAAARNASLPTLRSLGGTWAGCTGDKTAAEFVRDLRDKGE